MLPGASVTLQVPEPVMSLYLPVPPMQRDRPAFRALVGHEELVPVGVGLDARAGEGVAFGSRFGILRQRIARLSKSFDPSRVFTMPMHSADEFEPTGPMSTITAERQTV